MSEATSHTTVAHDDQRIVYTNGVWNECAVEAGPSSHCTHDKLAAVTFHFKGRLLVFLASCVDCLLPRNNDYCDWKTQRIQSI